MRPLSSEELKKLKVGDKVYISGRYAKVEKMVTVAKVPNQETIEAMNASPEPTSYNSAEELFKDLES